MTNEPLLPPLCRLSRGLQYCHAGIYVMYQEVSMYNVMNGSESISYSA